MVYYGAASKGCERCRQRKVRCDQRKPGCLKCELYGQQCTGYRNLTTVIFRDESDRVIRRTSQARQLTTSGALSFSKSAGLNESLVLSQDVEEAPRSTSLPQPILYSFYGLGAAFFARKYSMEGPSAVQQLGWLKELYLEGPQKAVLRIAIEAVGLAGLSNVYYAPNLALESKKGYCKSLLHLQSILSDPIQAATDTTLMTIYLLCLFEMINFDDWNRYRSWATHVQAIGSLLALRGKDQFTHERGTQLYLQVRSQIISACLRQQDPIPASLVYISYIFQTSSARQRWRQHNLATSGSICEIAFRVVNLRAAIHRKEVTDPRKVSGRVVEIDADLEAWRAGVHPHWRYHSVKDPDAEQVFDFERHIYPTVWVAEAWNGWRAMRIMIHQMAIKSGEPAIGTEEVIEPTAAQVIRQMSYDLCVSVNSFIDNPRLLSLIEPLYCVACETLNDAYVRMFAIKQLRSINKTMGVRQAALFADSAAKQHEDWSSTKSSQAD